MCKGRCDRSIILSDKAVTVLFVSCRLDVCLSLIFFHCLNIFVEVDVVRDWYIPLVWIYRDVCVLNILLNNLCLSVSIRYTNIALILYLLDLPGLSPEWFGNVVLLIILSMSDCACCFSTFVVISNYVSDVVDKYVDSIAINYGDEELLSVKLAYFLGRCWREKLL